MPAFRFHAAGAAIALLFSCGQPASGNPPDGGSQSGDAGATLSCAGGNSTEFVGSCTTTYTCIENYYTSATSEIVTLYRNACPSSGTFAQTHCPSTGYLCKCDDQRNIGRDIDFYTLQSECDACTHSCETRTSL